MNIIQCEQGTHEWFQARAGKITASEVCDAISFLKRASKNGTKGDSSEARENYKVAIVSEILSGECDLDGYISKCMKEGTENEPFARAAYEVRYDVSVEKVGFVIHPTIERSGASPDGLVGGDGGIEIKCPKTKTHLRYLSAGILPPEYEAQVMWNLACTGLDWWDFVSFDDRLPSRYKLFVKRVQRDEARIKEIEDGVRQFLAEVDEMIVNLEKLNPELTQAQRIFGVNCKDVNPDLFITDADLPEWARQ